MEERNGVGQKWITPRTTSIQSKTRNRMTIQIIQNTTNKRALYRYLYVTIFILLLDYWTCWDLFFALL
jgi:hypothetical protein